MRVLKEVEICFGNMTDTESVERFFITYNGEALILRLYLPVRSYL